MRTAFLISSLLLVAIATAAPRWFELNSAYTFDRYVEDFGKNYAKGSAEWTDREAIFTRRLKSVLAHNADKSQTYRRGVNKFSDWSASEWKRFNSAKWQTTEKVGEDGRLRGMAVPVMQYNSTGMPLPKTVDYRNSVPPVISSIKDQGDCGSCWAHSATESIESAFAVLTGVVPVLSQGQINDCSTEDDGCNGGLFPDGFNYVAQAKGIFNVWSYPYTDYFGGKKTSPCRDTSSWKELPVATVNEIWQVQPNNASALMESLYLNGPVSVSVDAGQWQDYEYGVLKNSPTASNFILDHDVQAVGYGYDRELQEPYWIVRNSWGVRWGESGFIRLARPVNEPCGQGFTKNITNCGTSGVLAMPGYPKVTEIKKRL